MNPQLIENFAPRSERGGGSYSYNDRLLRRNYIFDKELILIPINLGNAHWTLLAMYPGEGRMVYYDSMARAVRESRRTEGDRPK